MLPGTAPAGRGAGSAASERWRCEGTSIIGFGTYYRYASGHEGGAALAGFSPRRHHLAIYLVGEFENWHQSGGPSGHRPHQLAQAGRGGSRAGGCGGGAVVVAGAGDCLLCLWHSHGAIGCWSPRRHRGKVLEVLAGQTLIGSLAGPAGRYSGKVQQPVRT
jgi:hypothetical protein